MPRPRLHNIDEELIHLLAAHPAGLDATALREALSSHPSQPTLARRLLDLRARGKLIAQGKGRATRYLLASGNELPKLRSRLLHEAVAHKLIRQPGLLALAQSRLEKLRASNPSARRYHSRWSELISGPRTELLRALTEDSDSAADLRQESPFSTLLATDERKRVLQRLGG